MRNERSDIPHTQEPTAAYHTQHHANYRKKTSRITAGFWKR